MIMVADIKRAVAREYDLSVDVMSEPAPRGQQRTNTYEVSHPRQLAMSLAVELTKHSKSRVGHFFGGRDHTTVLHACRAIGKRRRADPELQAKLSNIMAELIQEENDNAQG